jgi:hypothetical protein
VGMAAIPRVVMTQMRAEMCPNPKERGADHGEGKESQD